MEQLVDLCPDCGIARIDSLAEDVFNLKDGMVAVAESVALYQETSILDAQMAQTEIVPHPLDAPADARPSVDFKTSEQEPRAPGSQERTKIYWKIDDERDSCRASKRYRDAEIEEIVIEIVR